MTATLPLDPVGDPIERAVDDVARRLRGPGRLRRDLLTELRDGLEDAASAHEEAGLDVAGARARAVAEFGASAEVGAACQAELTAVQARRTSLVVCVAAPGLQWLWAHWYPSLVLSTGLAPRPEGGLTVLHAAQTLIVWIVAAAALHQFLLLGRGHGPAASRVVAVLALAVLLTVGVVSGLMAASQDWQTLHVLLASPQGWVLAAVSSALWVVLGRLTWRTVVVTRHVGRSAPA